MLSANKSQSVNKNRRRREKKNSIRNEYFMARRHVHSKMNETYWEKETMLHSSISSSNIHHSYITIPYKNPCSRGRIIIIIISGVGRQQHCRNITKRKQH